MIPSLPIFDLDSHVVEPRDAWSRHIEPAFRDRALAIVDVPCEMEGVAGNRPHLSIGDRRLFSVGPVVPVGLAQVNAMLDEERARTAAGSKREGAEGSEAALFADLREILVPLEVSSPPEGHDGAARLRWMDSAGIRRAIVCPTWGLMWEQYLSTQPDVVCANMRSYNRWLADFCAPAPERLLGTAELSLVDLDWALAEVERVARAGFRVVRLRPVLHGGKTIAHPDFARFWDALVDNDLRLAFHIDGAGTDGDMFFAPGWYEGDVRGPASGAMVGCMPHVPAMMTLTAMFKTGLFERLPSLKLALLEIGAGWLGPYLAIADQVLRIARKTNGRLPSEIASTQLWASPIEAEDLTPLLVRPAPGVRVCFGSDYPHPESSQDPVKVWADKAGDVGQARLDDFFAKHADAFLA